MKSIRHRSLRNKSGKNRKILSRKNNKKNNSKRIRRIFGGSEPTTLKYEAFGGIRNKTELINKLNKINKDTIKNIQLTIPQYDKDPEGEYKLDDNGDLIKLDPKPETYYDIDKVIDRINQPEIGWGTKIVINYK